MQKLTRSLAMAGALAFAGVLAGCGDDVTVSTPTTVTVTPPSASIRVGETVTFTASVTGDVANKSVNWTSSDQAKATVDATGKVTAVAIGSATITATSAADPEARASALVTVTGRGVNGITVNPPNAILAPGQTLTVAANVDAEPGIARTVTWSSSANTIATISTAGVITAVAPGSATITATSTVDNTVTGTMALTVRAPIPPQISVQRVTVTGNTNQTVNFNNVAGGIDVTLNVEPGDATIQRVEVLLDGEVVCTQELAASESEALRLAAEFENVEAADVVCQINTAEFNATTGAIEFANGPRQLSARVITTTGTQVATPSVALTFNNQSGIVVTLTNNNGTDPASAVNPGTGLAWIGGSVTVNVVGVSYAPGVSVASATFNVFGKTRLVALTNNVGSVTFTEATNWSATNLGVNGYLSPAVGETFTGASAVLSNGQNLVTNLASVILNFGSGALGNATIPILPTIRLDNVAPGQTALNPGAPAQAAIAIAAMPVWVNATTAFGPGTVGIPTQTNLNASEAGVDAVTATVYWGAMGSLAGYNPGGLTNIAGSPAGTCDLTGLTAFTVGSNLAETLVSASYQARVEFKDALGNRVCMDLDPENALNPGANGSFGADFTAPTGTLTGPAANSAFQGVPPNFAVTASDNASGFGATPLNVVVRRTNAQTANACVIGLTASCTAEPQALAFDPTDGVAAPANEGYYVNTIALVDQAGNSTTLTTDRVFLLDDPAVIAPGSTAEAGLSGGISLPSVIAGATTNNFAATPVEDLDLARIFGVTAYPTANIQYPAQTLGEYNTPLQRGGAGINYSVANWIRCLNNPGDFATTTNQPTAITLTVVDQAGGSGSLASPAFGANAQACNAVSDIAINAFGTTPATALTVAYGTGKTQVDIDGATLATASATSVVLTVIADVPLNTSTNPFQRVEFFYQNTAGNLVSIGSGTGTLAQTPTNRTWTYTFTWDPDASVQAPAAVNIVAIGVDVQGDAVMSNALGAVTVATVP